MISREIRGGMVAMMRRTASTKEWRAGELALLLPLMRSWLSWLSERIQRCVVWGRVGSAFTECWTAMPIAQSSPMLLVPCPRAA